MEDDSFLLRNLPDDIGRLIYLKWYYPYVMQELVQRVPRRELYAVSVVSDGSDSVNMTVVIFKMSSGKYVRMLAHTSTINRLNRKNTLKTIIRYPHE